MDLDKAIAAHTEWKTKFRGAITAQSTMDAATIGKDNCCPLGQWLHGDAKKQFPNVPALAECISAHAKFHREAGKVAQLINMQRFEEATSALRPGTGFSEASTEAATAIIRLKKVLQK